GVGIIYVDQELRPAPPSALELLNAAARAPSLSDYVQQIGWMNPIYAKLRQALASRIYRRPAEFRLLQLNLERARALHAGRGRFGPDAHVLDPMSVDWHAVAAGRVQVNLRQRPGPANSMGKMKFMFPNSQGIWLHDTPEKEKIEDAARLESNGCVRLEDAARFA